MRAAALLSGGYRKSGLSKWLHEPPPPETQPSDDLSTQGDGAEELPDKYSKIDLLPPGVAAGDTVWAVTEYIPHTCTKVSSYVLIHKHLVDEF